MASFKNNRHPMKSSQTSHKKKESKEAPCPLQMHMFKRDMPLVAQNYG
jgi:hypothetical protein